MQGFHGFTSHKGDLAYSVDFDCTEGTTVVASKDGRVIAVKEDSDSGCPDPSCADQGNYVLLDHGDGTYSEYYHLRYLGALVEPGQEVCRGQAIAVCGNTGYSSGPHLHFGVIDAARRTIPVQFAEPRRSIGFGFPVEGSTYISRNTPVTSCDSSDHSSLSASAFAHQGVVLDEPFPVVIDAENRPESIRGVYYGDHRGVAIHLKHEKSKEWTDICSPTSDYGRFSIPLTWTAERYPDGIYWVMVTGSTPQKNGTCASPGWAWSYKLFFDSENKVPDGMSYQDWIDSIRENPKTP